MPTINLGLPLITGNNNADVVRDMNALANEIDIKVPKKQDVVDVSTDLTTHKAEDAIHLAGGTANAITITTGANYSYGQFKQLKFKATANNTGNVTINVDGKGAVPGLKFDGTQLAAGAIKANKVYDWYYDTASGGRFFLIAKASGNATAGDVLAPKTFSSDEGEFVGTLVDRPPNTLAVSSWGDGAGSLYARIPLGAYRTPTHNGNAEVVVEDSDYIASNIKKDVNMFGLIGTFDPGAKPGTLSIANSSATKTHTGNTNYTKAKEMQLTMGGAYRISFGLFTSGGTAYGRIYRNGVPVGIERSTTSGNAVTFSEDVAGWNEGDLIQLWIRISSGSFIAYCSNYSISIAPPTITLN